MTVVVSPLVVVAAVEAELRAFREAPSAVAELLAAGIGAASQERFAGYLRAYPARVILNVGVAGALEPEMEAGTVVVVEGWRRPEAPHDEAARAEGNLQEKLEALLDRHGIPWQPGDAVTLDRPLGDAAERDALRAATGARIVEMEGALWAAEAARRHIPFAAVRVISDHADAPLSGAGTDAPDRDRVLRPDGAPREGVAGSRADGSRTPEEEARLTRAGRAWAAAQRSLERLARALQEGGGDLVPPRPRDLPGAPLHD